MKTLVKKLSLVILAFVLAFGFTACESNVGRTLVNEDFESRLSTVTYGTYAQKLVTDETLIGVLGGLEYDENNRVVHDRTEYERVEAAEANSGKYFADGKTKIKAGEVYYFVVLPIEWYTVQSGSKILHLSKNILDAVPFNTNTSAGEVDAQGNYPNNWTISTLREYLNGSFANRAFTGLEYSAIDSTKVVSKYQGFYESGSVAIPDCWDKLFALSYKEITDEALGFTADSNGYDCMRMAQVTDYARAKGVKFYTTNASEGNVDYDREMHFNGNGEYWLRSVGWKKTHAGTVRYNGLSGENSQYVNSWHVGIRPAFNATDVSVSQ